MAVVLDTTKFADWLEKGNPNADLGDLFYKFTIKDKSNNLTECYASILELMGMKTVVAPKVDPVKQLAYYTYLMFVDKDAFLQINIDATPQQAMKKKVLAQQPVWAKAFDEITKPLALLFQDTFSRFSLRKEYKDYVAKKYKGKTPPADPKAWFLKGSPDVELGPVYAKFLAEVEFSPEVVPSYTLTQEISGAKLHAPNKFDAHMMHAFYIYMNWLDSDSPNDVGVPKKTLDLVRASVHARPGSQNDKREVKVMNFKNTYVDVLAFLKGQMVDAFGRFSATPEYKTLKAKKEGK